MSQGQSLRATDLADKLGVSRVRITQMVKAGQLDGCFTGEGRARRFDLNAVSERLGHKLDPGQMMGNGAMTKERLKGLAQEGVSPDGLNFDDEPEGSKSGSPLPQSDPGRYELARILKAEEDARKARLDNERREGTWVLASEVGHRVARAMASEIVQFEVFLKEAANEIYESAEEAKHFRVELMKLWRDYRSTRSNAAEIEALAAELSDAEEKEDF